MNLCKPHGKTNLDVLTSFQDTDIQALFYYPYKSLIRHQSCDTSIACGFILKLPLAEGVGRGEG